MTGPATRGEEIEQWQVIKDAASAAIIEMGGTITHHHAVGRDHAPWYRQEQAPLYLESLRAMKRHPRPAGDPEPGHPFHVGRQEESLLPARGHSVSAEVLTVATRCPHVGGP